MMFPKLVGPTILYALAFPVHFPYILNLPNPSLICCIKLMKFEHNLLFHYAVLVDDITRISDFRWTCLTEIIGMLIGIILCTIPLRHAGIVTFT